MIAPIDMLNCVFDRTRAVVECLSLSLESKNHVANKQTIIEALWQITDNISQAKTIADNWHTGEVRNHRQGATETTVSLHCQTGNTQEEVAK
ncbi:MAG: hypothetical protein ACI8PB_004692 [Desulforhopalus sp.]